MKAIITNFACAFTVATLCACSGSSELADAREESRPAPFSFYALPALPPTDFVPELHGSPRRASAVADVPYYASQYFDKGPGAFMDGNDLRLVSNPGEFEWAIYAMPMPDLELSEIYVILNQGKSDYFVALSDYTHNSWEVTGYDETPYVVIEPRPGIQYGSASGWLYVAVISYDGVDVLIDSLLLRYTVPDQTTTLLTPIGEGGLVSLTEYDGRPLIAVANSGLDRVECWLADAPDPRQIGDFSIHTVHELEISTGFLGIEAEVIGGRPAIAWSTASLGVKYAAANVDEPGTGADWTVSQIGGFSGGLYPDLDKINDKPIMVFRETSGSERTFFSSSSKTIPEGSDDWDSHQVILFPSTNDGPYSLHTLTGKPHILAQVYDSAHDDYDHYLFKATTELPTNILDWESFQLFSSGTDWDSLEAFRYYPWALVDGRPEVMLSGEQPDRRVLGLGRYAVTNPQDNNAIQYLTFSAFFDPATQFCRRPIDFQSIDGIPYILAGVRRGLSKQLVNLRFWRGTAPQTRVETEFVYQEIPGEGAAGWAADPQFTLIDGKLTIVYVDRSLDGDANLVLVSEDPPA